MSTDLANDRYWMKRRSQKCTRQHSSIHTWIKGWHGTVTSHRQRLFKIILTRPRFERTLQKLPPSGADDSIVRNNLTSLTESRWAGCSNTSFTRILTLQREDSHIIYFIPTALLTMVFYLLTLRMFESISEDFVMTETQCFIWRRWQVSYFTLLCPSSWAQDLCEELTSTLMNSLLESNDEDEISLWTRELRPMKNDSLDSLELRFTTCSTVRHTVVNLGVRSAARRRAREQATSRSA